MTNLDIQGLNYLVDQSNQAASPVAPREPMGVYRAYDPCHPPDCWSAWHKASYTEDIIGMKSLKKVDPVTNYP